MRTSKIPIRLPAKGGANARRWLLLLLWVALIPPAASCQKGGAPPIDGRLAIESVAKWYQLYRADHNGKAAPDEAAFLAFIRAKLAERGQTMEDDSLLTSERDGQKYVIRYGAKAPTDLGNNLAVHEKEGYNGKILIAFESARSREIDAAELPSLLEGPKQP